MEFGSNIKKLMEERGISSKALSDATDIPPSSLSEWINGRVPRIDNSLIRLARFFGVSIEYLISGKEPEEVICNDILNSLPDKFSTIHKGIYRVTVDKLQDGIDFNQ
jgi:transcriptional regulator with XRE-family HTH domain